MINLLCFLCFEKKLNIWIAKSILLNIKHKMYVINPKHERHNFFFKFRFFFFIVFLLNIFINLLDFCPIKPYPVFLVFWDQDEITKWLDEKRITRIHLPSKRSDLNPIENLWYFRERWRENPPFTFCLVDNSNAKYISIFL